MLNAITCDALGLLLAYRAKPERAALTPATIDLWESHVPGRPRFGLAQFGVSAPIDPAWLGWNGERFSNNILQPMMADLARRIPMGAYLSGEGMQLPLGITFPESLESGGVNEQYRGVSMRCIIAERAREDRPAPWSEIKKHYNIGIDEFVTEPVALILRFDVIQDNPPTEAPRTVKAWTSRALVRAIART